MTIKGVSVGDKFYKQLEKGKESLCEVVDFVERKSITTGKHISYECYAKSIDGKYVLGRVFETPFTSVIRHSHHRRTYTNGQCAGEQGGKSGL